MEIKLQSMTLLLVAVFIFTVMAGAYMITNTSQNVSGLQKVSALGAASTGSPTAGSSGAPIAQAAAPGSASLGGCSAGKSTGGCGCGGGAAASAGKVTGGAATASAGVANAQDVYIKALANGQYDNMQVTVKKGTPIKLHFSADPNAGCGRYFKIYGLGVDASSQNGVEQVVEFTPTTEGTYDYSCVMTMWGPGKFIVTS
ncbi:Cupredoxin-like domain protein [Candidatus Gugararchaeum adminiculabundum]|nr:Cupredoxin-like domain protein [Candidatus Gugararchaeum adminiculabundum]